MTAAIDRTFSSLRVPNYRRYFTGQVVSISGNWMQIVAEMWLIVELTGSGAAVGITAGLQFLPMLLFGAWGGLLADRLDKRTLLTVTRVACRLEEQGLVSRAPDPADGRSALITVTPAGRDVLEAIRTRKDAFLTERLEALGPEDRATLERAAALLEGMLE